jgi:hypothetical protein
MPFRLTSLHTYSHRTHVFAWAQPYAVGAKLLAAARAHELNHGVDREGVQIAKPTERGERFQRADDPIVT